MLQPGVRDNGVELVMVEAPNSLYGWAWKRKLPSPQNADGRCPDRFANQISQALPAWYKFLGF